MYVYREKNNLIHKLHPMTSVAWIGVVLLLSLLLNHPVFLMALFLSTGLVIIAAGIAREWSVYLKMSIILTILIILVNALFSKAGSTILLNGPQLPILGSVLISFEALCYGVGMGLRLLVIISVFCFYTYGIHPDKVLKLVSKGNHKSVLAITLSARLFPLLAMDFHRIAEVQRCRGVRWETGSWWQRGKNLLPMMSVLLLSSLERSLQMAEAMQARGYGLEGRSFYRQDYWQRRDRILLAGEFLALMLGIVVVLEGWGTYSYYPILGEIHSYEIILASVIALLLSLPAILQWGWRKWPLLQSKI